MGPFRRNFGNSLDQCLNPIWHRPNFCTSQNVPDGAPTYNNLRQRRATFGATGIVAVRFLPRRVSVWK